jgi:hypothetical protein
MAYEERAKWLEQIEHCFNAVYLFGTQAVHDAVDGLKGAVEAGMGEEGYPDSPDERAFQDAFKATVAAMRKDTAPTESAE